MCLRPWIIFSITAIHIVFVLYYEVRFDIPLLCCIKQSFCYTFHTKLSSSFLKVDGQFEAVYLL